MPHDELNKNVYPKSSGYLFYISVRCVVKYILVVHTWRWSCIVETLHTNGHCVTYDAHQTIKHDMWGHWTDTKN
jgi:hypothetical protein